MRTSLVLLLLAACADPAADKTDAVVQDAPPAATPAAPAVAGEVLPATGTIGFTGAKVTKSHDGAFSGWKGTLRLDGDRVVGAEVEVDVASLATDAVKLDNHLRGADFFDVANQPTATFRTSEIREGAPAGSKLEGANATVAGDLTIRGVTKRVEVPAVVTVAPDKATAHTEFAINRHDFGITYPGKPDDLIRDEVVVRVDLSAARNVASGGGAPATGDAQPAPPPTSAPAGAGAAG